MYNNKDVVISAVNAGLDFSLVLPKFRKNRCVNDKYNQVHNKIFKDFSQIPKRFLNVLFYF